MLIEFSKMHGLGNDFMVLDLVTQRVPLNPDIVKNLADRHFGVGFDQLLVVESPNRPDVDFSYRIFNADGSEVEQCGNGVRCFARFVQMRQLTLKRTLKVETKSGVITLFTNDAGWVQVDMGRPKFEPEEIPFTPKSVTKIQNSYRMSIAGEPVELYIANMGNPHAVIKVEDVLAADVKKLGKAIEAHPAFPEKVNVGFMQVMNEHHIRLRVYERGVGETSACGTGACAAVVTGIREGWLAVGEDIRAQLYGGSLMIRWGEGAPVIMTGPTSHVYDGVLDIEAFA